MTISAHTGKDLLDKVEQVTRDYNQVSTVLVNEYAKFCDVVRTNGLARLHGKHWQTTFDLPSSSLDLTWMPDITDTDIAFSDGDYTYAMPRAYLQNPDAWLQGALAAHGQAVADNAARAAQDRADRKAMLRRQLAELEAEG